MVSDVASNNVVGELRALLWNARDTLAGLLEKRKVAESQLTKLTNELHAAHEERADQYAYDVQLLKETVHKTKVVQGALAAVDNPCSSSQSLLSAVLGNGLGLGTGLSNADSAGNEERSALLRAWLSVLGSADESVVAEALEAALRCESAQATPEGTPQPEPRRLLEDVEAKEEAAEARVLQARRSCCELRVRQKELTWQLEIRRAETKEVKKEYHGLEEEEQSWIQKQAEAEQQSSASCAHFEQQMVALDAQCQELKAELRVSQSEYSMDTTASETPHPQTSSKSSSTKVQHGQSNKAGSAYAPAGKNSRATPLAVSTPMSTSSNSTTTVANSPHQRSSPDPVLRASSSSPDQRSPQSRAPSPDSTTGHSALLEEERLMRKPAGQNVRWNETSGLEMPSPVRAPLEMPSPVRAPHSSSPVSWAGMTMMDDTSCQALETQVADLEQELTRSMAERLKLQKQALALEHESASCAHSEVTARDSTSFTIRSVPPSAISKHDDRVSIGIGGATSSSTSSAFQPSHRDTTTRGDAKSNSAPSAFRALRSNSSDSTSPRDVLDVRALRSNSTSPRDDVLDASAQPQPQPQPQPSAFGPIDRFALPQASAKERSQHFAESISGVIERSQNRSQHGSESGRESFAATAAQHFAKRKGHGISFAWPRWDFDHTVREQEFEEHARERCQELESVAETAEQQADESDDGSWLKTVLKTVVEEEFPQSMEGSPFSAAPSCNVPSSASTPAQPGNRTKTYDVRPRWSQSSYSLLRRSGYSDQDLGTDDDGGFSSPKFGSQAVEGCSTNADLTCSASSLNTSDVSEQSPLSYRVAWRRYQA